MFRPLAMRRLRLLVLERDEKTVLRSLAAMGAVQLTRTAAGDLTAPGSPPDRTRDMARCDRLISRVSEIRRTLEAETLAGHPPEGIAFEEAEATVLGWEQRAGEWNLRRTRLLESLEKLDATLEQVKPYRGLELPLEQVSQSPFLCFLTGSLPPRGLEHMPVTRGSVVLPLPYENGRQPVVALTSIIRRAELEEALRGAGFQGQPVSPRHGLTPERVHADACREREKLTAELDRTAREGRELAAAAAQPLADIQQWAAVERRLFEAEQFFPRTQAAALIVGWVPANRLWEIKDRLQACTSGRCVTETVDARDIPDQEIPVLLRHGRLLKPFEALVTAYGLPRYSELSPTLFVAVSYVLMFGMMFGDVGHGGILALAGAAILVRQTTAVAKHVGVLLFANGLSSAAFGMAYGSFFGLPWFREHAWWRDPLEGDPMTLMLAAIGIGVVLMSVGLLLNIINRLRQGDLMDGLLGKFGVAGVIFYWGALALAGKSTAIHARGWFGWALVLLVGVPVACWAVKGPLELLWRSPSERESGRGGVFAAVLESLVGAFEGLLLYLANTISFVRLAAYAMSHAALLMATFTLADQVRQFEACGSTLGIVVIVLGNLAAFALEGIVAAVQALRLEYYEFFGKFFSGDGQPFKPFSLVADRTA